MDLNLCVNGKGILAAKKLKICEKQITEDGNTRVFLADDCIIKQQQKPFLQANDIASNVLSDGILYSVLYACSL
jgi:hypothetical protein